MRKLTPSGSKKDGSRATRIDAGPQPVVDAPHGLEKAVQRLLLGHPDLRFSSLVVRRIPHGVCLEGVMESDSDVDVGSLAHTVSGVDEVINHLVVRRMSAIC